MFNYIINPFKAIMHFYVKEIFFHNIEFGNFDSVHSALKSYPWLANSKMRLVLSSPLHVAALYGHEQIVTLLIEAEADVNAQNYNNDTPLHKAAVWGNNKIIEQLINAGADVNKLNDQGFPPIISAIFHNKHETVKLLIENHTNLKIESSSRILSAAVKAGHYIILKHLIYADINIDNIEINTIIKDSKAKINLVSCIKLLVQYGNTEIINVESLNKMKNYQSNIVEELNNLCAAYKEQNKYYHFIQKLNSFARVCKSPLNDFSQSTKLPYELMYKILIHLDENYIDIKIANKIINKLNEKKHLSDNNFASKFAKKQNFLNNIEKDVNSIDNLQI
ncbi:MAG: ankyrin repeat domain-containing protein [Alphaproteobacteria bacterium]